MQRRGHTRAEAGCRLHFVIEAERVRQRGGRNESSGLRSRRDRSPGWGFHAKARRRKGRKEDEESATRKERPRTGQFADCCLFSILQSLCVLGRLRETPENPGTIYRA